jgi:glycosyltransferase involved in cell wall biosynthesis
MYEQYTHYVPGDSEALKRFVVDLATRYANLCDRVVAPSESIAAVLHRRGVTAPVSVIPTGVRLERFEHGDGFGFRAAMGIPPAAFLVGHLGRLAPEKNLEFLAEAVAAFLDGEPRAHFLIVGRGPSEQPVRDVFARHGLTDRLHLAGILDEPRLAGCYQAMDVFAFASKSETQGMVLTEAMAAGVPVVALDAPGAREVVSDGRNGRLLESAATVAEFRAGLEWVAGLSDDGRRRLERGATETAADFSMTRCADKALALYRELRHGAFVGRRDEYKSWAAVRRLIATEWDLLKGTATAAGAALHLHEPGSDQHS